MLIRKRSGPTENEVTPLDLFLDRRRFVLGAAAVLGSAWANRQAFAADCSTPLPDNIRLADGEKLSPLSDITGYNNYYEFTTDKKMVKHLAQALTVTPWQVTVEGECEKPFVMDLDDLRRLFGSEERIYRFRCVEGWSMVVPWGGFPLCKVIERARPTSRAKFVEFVSLRRPSEMIGQRGSTSGVDWPYREGLRIDEAMHPLTFAVTGLYGEPLPKQNGAPLRIAIPWKYGFKSSKAVTHIRLLAEQPVSSWARLAPEEYGFYGNVNPEIAHPRWSQARENRIGELRKRPTLMLNGYADQVAGLYAGMNPAKLY